MTTLKSTRSRSDWLLPILCLFTVTFFVYRDFEIRTLYGYAVLIFVLGLNLLGRLVKNRPPVLDSVRTGLLFLAAAVGFIHQSFHRRSDIIPVKNNSAVFVACRPARRLNQ